MMRIARLARKLVACCGNNGGSGGRQAGLRTAKRFEQPAESAFGLLAQALCREHGRGHPGLIANLFHHHFVFNPIGERKIPEEETLLQNHGSLLREGAAAFPHDFGACRDRFVNNFFIFEGLKSKYPGACLPCNALFTGFFCGNDAAACFSIGCDYPIFKGLTGIEIFFNLAFSFKHAMRLRNLKITSNEKIH